MNKKLPPIKERIRAAYENGIKDYHQLIDKIFPKEHFPNAFRRRNAGGPPGCAMAFNRAIREMGGTWYKNDYRRTVYIPPVKDTVNE
jgi:hypothetical protein